jgi:predicted ribosome quality control (RQC) complex YloA/Tae2 family protein
LDNGLDWLRRLAREGGWAPSLAFDPVTETPLAFAPYELTHLGPCRSYPSISQAAVAFYTATLGGDSYAGRRAHVQALLMAARKRLETRQAALRSHMAQAHEAERFRQYGEWILAYASTLPTGTAELVADTGAETLRIPLDPALSAVDNAQTYFVRYRKARRALDRIPGLLAEVERDLAYLDQLQTDLDLADNAAHIEELRQAVLATGLVPPSERRQRSPLPASTPLRLRSCDGFEVIIGRHALQNERVTWELAGPDDLWLHTERVPGAHVIIRTHGRPVPPTTLEQAAGWAAYYSAARHDTKVGVLYTQRRHLRRVSGGRPGEVRVLQAQSLWVAPTPPPPSTGT